jgi:sugar O-acyltransferase (sialic acid O-acetyltransferase NeuD family)
MFDAPELILIGAGGHACMLIDALRAARDGCTLAILDQDPARHGTLLLDVPIIGDDGVLESLVRRGTLTFAVAVGGIGDNEPRAKIFEHALSLGLRAKTIVHSGAIVSPWAIIGEGCQIMPGAIVNAGSRLGRNVIVNTAAVVEHDCIIGDHVHIATGARLAGTVTVDAYAHIGAGAVIRQTIVVGRGSVVAAGAVVVRNVLPAAIVAGVPAKVMRG